MENGAIYEEIVALNRGGIPAVLATVVDSSGSSPRKAGAKMLVRRDRSTLGSIGGGSVEQQVVAAALDALEEGVPRVVSFTLTEEHGHVCGGRLQVYVEPVLPRPHLVIIGGGHVGKALATAAAFAGFRVSVTDDRAEYADSARFPEADDTFAGDAASALDRFAVGNETFIVIATTGFEEDIAAARAALGTPARYIGMMGSGRKRDVLWRRLAEEGYRIDQAERITVPVGLAIRAETPAEIAISITAQLVEARRSHAAARVGHTACGRDVAQDGVLQATPAG